MDMNSESFQLNCAVSKLLERDRKLSSACGYELQWVFKILGGNDSHEKVKKRGMEKWPQSFIVLNC